MARIYVGNLPYSTNDQDLAQAFSQFGSVVSSAVIKDKATRRSKGFGFVEFESEEVAQAAISGMDGKDFEGRTLKVSMAKPMEQR
ncbi:MAG: RNA-binding protein [Patescibacteria group bacterium]|nr:MAG: RNA-binding protein [Patescibacteria group bacterium]